jgi:hypothetical protein
MQFTLASGDTDRLKSKYSVATARYSHTRW